MQTIFLILYILLSSYIIWRATNGFELASDYLGRNMNKGIKGATINAVASSMPEFLATMFFMFYLKNGNGFSGGVGITGGSAIFNILIIPVCIYFFGFWGLKKRKIIINRKVLLRDGITLIVMTLLVTIILHNVKLTFINGLLLVIPYLGYILLLIYSQKKTSRSKAVSYHYKKTDRLKFIDLPLLNIEKLILRNRRITTTNAWMMLVASTLLMIIGTWMLVDGTDKLGNALNIPLVFISVILAAAASSIPDTMISIRDARKGNIEDAFSNALGSNIFNISFALGFPLLLFTLIFSPIQMEEKVIAASTDIWFILLIITILTLVILSIGKYFNLIKTTLLILLYLLFISFIIVEIYKPEINITDTLMEKFHFRWL